MHTSGQKIYDSTGKQFNLYACVIQNGDGNFISQTDLQNIKNMGFNAIKWWLIPGAFMPTSTSINVNYFTTGQGAPAGNALDTIVNQCEQIGLYVIIGVGWTEYWLPPTWSKLGRWDGTALWTDQTTHNGFVYMYNWVANRYASRSHVIFESVNEITGNSESDINMPGFASYNNDWISAIESAEGANHHLKIVQMLLTPNGSFITTNLPFVNGAHTNVMMATHSYPFVYNWMSTDLEINYAKRWADAIHSQNMPWVDTEFSTAYAPTSNPPPRNVGLQQAMDMFTKYNAAGWGYFCYDSNPALEGEWNLRNPANETEILSVLQPYMNEVTSSWLHTVGTKIYNQANQEVVFNGISTMTLFGYETLGNPYPALYEPADMAVIRSHGLNLVRLELTLNTAVYGVPASQQTPTQLTYNSQFFPALDALVQAAAQQGLWVNLLFCTSDGTWSPNLCGSGGGNGFPTWMYNGSWSYFNKVYPNTIDGRDSAIRDFWNIYDSTAANVRKAYQTFWKDLANHFKNSPNVIFGLYNEPQNQWGGNTTIWSDQALGATAYKTFMEETIDIIRTVAPNNLIFQNCAYFWSFSTNLKIERANVAVECHAYSVIGQSFVDLGYRYNQPFFLGEFGGIEEGLQDRAGTIANMQFCNSVGASRSYLSYRPHDATPKPSAQTWTDLQTYLVPNIKYYAETITPTLAGFPWWTIPIGIAIGGGYLLKKYGKKPRG